MMHIASRGLEEVSLQFRPSKFKVIQAKHVHLLGRTLPSWYLSIKCNVFI